MHKLREKIDNILYKVSNYWLELQHDIEETKFNQESKDRVFEIAEEIEKEMDAKRTGGIEYRLNSKKIDQELNELQELISNKNDISEAVDILRQLIWNHWGSPNAEKAGGILIEYHLLKKDSESIVRLIRSLGRDDCGDAIKKLVELSNEQEIINKIEKTWAKSFTNLRYEGELELSVIKLTYLYVYKNDWDKVIGLMKRDKAKIRKLTLGTLHKLTIKRADISPVFSHIKDILMNADESITGLAAGTLEKHFKAQVYLISLDRGDKAVLEGYKELTRDVMETYPKNDRYLMQKKREVLSYISKAVETMQYKMNKEPLRWNYSPKQMRIHSKKVIANG